MGFTKLRILIFFRKRKDFLERIVKEAALEAMTKAGLDNVEAVAKTDFEFILKKFNSEFINKNAK